MTTDTEPETVSVNRQALREVLMALIGPAHLIRELQATRGLPVANPITTLITDYVNSDPKDIEDIDD